MVDPLVLCAFAVFAGFVLGLLLGLINFIGRG